MAEAGMDVARLGLQVDGRGYLRDVNAATRANEQLAASGTKAEVSSQRLDRGLRGASGAAARIARDVQLATRDFNAGRLSTEGYRVAIQRARLEVDRLGLAGGLGLPAAISRAELSLASGSLAARQMATQTQAAGVATTGLARATSGAGRGIGTLRSILSTTAAQAAGMKSSVGQLSGALLMFGAGNAVAIGILAGLGAMGLAFRKLTESARESRKELQKFVDTQADAARAARPVESRLGFDLEAARARRDSLIGQLRFQQQLRTDPRTLGLQPGAALATPLTGPQFERLQREVDNLSLAIAQAELTIRQERIITQEEIRAAARTAAGLLRVAENAEGLAVDLARVDHAFQGVMRQFGRFNPQQFVTVPRPVSPGGVATEAQVQAAFGGLGALEEVIDAERRRELGLIEAALSIEAEVLAMQRQAAAQQALRAMIDGGALSAEQRAAAERVLQKQLKESTTVIDSMVKQLAAIGIGLLASRGGVLGGVAAGGIGGFLAAGPVGAVAGALGGLVGGLLGSGKAAREAAREFRQLSRSLNELADNTIGPLSREVFNAARLFQEAKEALKKSGGGASELRGLEQAFRRAIARIREQFQEDLRVRLLVAQGRDAEADALRLQIAQERELADARRAGLGVETLALLEQVQAAERLAAASKAAADAIRQVTSALNAPEGLNLALLRFRAAGQFRPEEFEPRPPLPPPPPPLPPPPPGFDPGDPRLRPTTMTFGDVTVDLVSSADDTPQALADRFSLAMIRLGTRGGNLLTDVRR